MKDLDLGDTRMPDERERHEEPDDCSTYEDALDRALDIDPVLRSPRDWELILDRIRMHEGR